MGRNQLLTEMKKTYSIEVDCANCANLVEAAVARVAGVESVTVAFMTQKMKVEYAEGVDAEAVLAEIVRVARKIEPDFEILK